MSELVVQTMAVMPVVPMFQRDAEERRLGRIAAARIAGHRLEFFCFCKQIGTLPTEGPTLIWPDPKGSQVVETSARDVALVAIDGTRKWSLPIQGVTEALWLDDGTLALISAAGLARLDPATGAITATRCGWRFELSTTPHPVTANVEPVCVQRH